MTKQDIQFKLKAIMNKPREATITALVLKNKKLIDVLSEIETLMCDVKHVDWMELSSMRANIMTDIELNKKLIANLRTGNPSHGYSLEQPIPKVPANPLRK